MGALCRPHLRLLEAGEPLEVASGKGLELETETVRDAGADGWDVVEVAGAKFEDDATLSRDTPGPEPDGSGAPDRDGDLGEHGGPEEEHAAERSDGGPQDLRDLDRVARKLLGDPDPGEEPDEDASPGWRDEPDAPDRPEVAEVEVFRQWTPGEVEAFLGLVVNPRLEAQGKQPLTEEEIRSGGKVMAPILTRLLAPRNVDSEWAMFWAWVVTVFGARYWEDVYELVANFVRWLLGRPIPDTESMPDSPEASDGEDEDEPGDWPTDADDRGWSPLGSLSP